MKKVKATSSLLALVKSGAEIKLLNGYIIRRGRLVNQNSIGCFNREMGINTNSGRFALTKAGLQGALDLAQGEDQ